MGICFIGSRNFQDFIEEVKDYLLTVQTPCLCYQNIKPVGARIGEAEKERNYVCIWLKSKS